MKHTKAQIATLKELRRIFFELGFEVYNMVCRYAKDPLEFVAIEKVVRDIGGLSDGHNIFTSAVVRLYHDTAVRICFLEASVSVIERAGRRELCRRIRALNGKKGCVAVVVRDEYRNNPSCPFPKRYWHQFVYQEDLKRTGLARAVQQLKNAGSVLKRGTRTLT